MKMFVRMRRTLRLKREKRRKKAAKRNSQPKLIQDRKEIRLLYFAPRKIKTAFFQADSRPINSDGKVCRKYRKRNEKKIDFTDHFLNVRYKVM